MKQIFTLLCIWSTFCTLTAQTKSLPEFNRISTSGNVKVEILNSDQHKVEYTIIKGYPDDLIIDIRNQTLTVKIKNQSMKWGRSSTKAKVTVYAKEIRGIDCSAGSSLKSSDTWQTEHLAIDVSSGANCKLALNVQSLSADASSGASLSISGKASSASFDASSGASVDASELVSVTVSAVASSGGGIKSYVTERINASASSGGSVRYKGNPTERKIDAKVSGSVKAY